MFFDLDFVRLNPMLVTYVDKLEFGKMNMSKRISAFIPYVIALAITFYALPFLICDTGSGMFLMLLIIPLLTFACSVAYGIRQGFDIFFTLITVIIFVPTIFIFYNSSAWIYIVAYGIVSLVGNLIGMIFYKKKNG